MRLCLMIEGQEDVTWEDWVAVARACEEHGVETLFRSDHYLSVEGRGEHGSLDAWATVNALAAVTTTLRLGTLVSPATFRHPSELAKVVTTADHDDRVVPSHSFKFTAALQAVVPTRLVFLARATLAGDAGYVLDALREAASLLYNDGKYFVGKRGDIVSTPTSGKAYSRPMAGSRDSGRPVATNNGRIQVAIHVAFSATQHTNGAVAT